MARFFVIFLLIVGGSIFFWTTRVEVGGVSSPIPKVFGKTVSTKTNEWFPKSELASDTQDLYMSARSALAVDYDTGKVLFARETNKRLPIASTLKIMTALVALEMADPNVTLKVSEKAASVGENSMGLTLGEQLSLKELLYGLMLVSGNDAAVTIAEGVSDSEEGFVGTMNKKAQELGLEDTHFVNATGLDEDSGNSYSTVYDMVTLAHYTWEKYPIFRQITSTEHYYIEATENHKDFDLYNDTNLLTTYPGVKGIKPGFTWEAGLCLVTYAENKQSLRSSSSENSTAGLEGKRILAVILGSDDRRGEMKELLDYAFGQYGITIEHPGLDL